MKKIKNAKQIGFLMGLFLAVCILFLSINFQSSVLANAEDLPTPQFSIVFENVQGATNPNSTTGSTPFELQPATRTGFIFVGWFTDPTGGREVTEVGETRTVYARWETFTVTFRNLQGATHPSTIRGTIGEPINLYAVTREGYTFVGWFNAETGGVRVLQANGDITVYARWHSVTAGDNGDDIPWWSLDNTEWWWGLVGVGIGVFLWLVFLVFKKLVKGGK
ncbi:MAG: InlB B-repeat-containing protein [Firmicutes bacterium]|nr:InlB B-repeat-containing protein [Bacillota bacterium]